MPTPRTLARHPVTYVDTIAPQGERVRRGHVACGRRGETVSTDMCAHCPRFVKVVAGEGRGQVDTLHCADEPMHLLPQAPPSTPPGTPLTLARLPVSALMTRSVVCVRPELGLDAAVSLFVETGHKALPVVDAAGRLLGFVTESDVMLHVQACRRPPRPETLADVYLPYALSIPETASVTRAAALMALEGQPRLAVVSRDQTVVGVLTASDVMYWLARADGQLR